MTRSTEARITWTSQKKLNTVDHNTSEISIAMRDASGKEIGSVFFPSNLSPFSSLKSAACIVVRTMRELAISATTLEGVMKQSAPWRPSGEHNARYSNRVKTYQLLVWRQIQSLHIRQRCIHYGGSNGNEIQDRCMQWWINI